MIEFARIILPVCSVLILVLCFSALFRRSTPQPGNARLIHGQKVFPFKTRELSVGSDKTCDIVIQGKGVLPHHGVIRCDRYGWHLLKFKSSSPVYINGKVQDKKYLLVSGDRLTFGSVTLIFDNRLVKNER